MTLSETAIPQDVAGTDPQVRQLVQRARRDGDERRGATRFPFYYPATLRFDHSADFAMPAYVRDISTTGIGLIHSQPLKLDDVVMIAFDLENGDSVSLRVRIRWCSNCDQAWYASGGEFLDDTDELPRWSYFS